MDEDTTSSPSNANYSIWKAVAREDDIAAWLTIMMSLPFMHGFVNERWRKCIDTMLEKKFGIRKVHMLRIIGILEADFNTALKILYGKRLMEMAEKAGLHEEQWGSRSNRTSTDPALMFMMTVEYGRYMKATIGLFNADQGSCFDRMYPSLSNALANVHGMDEKANECRAKTLESMEHHCKTGLGVSKRFYTNKPGKPKKLGEVQGKGDVPCLWALTSSVLLFAMNILYAGVRLPSAGGKADITATNFGFVDDIRTLAAAFACGIAATQRVLDTLTVAAQKWANVMDVTAAYTAFHKCLIQILAWKIVKSSYVID